MLDWLPTITARVIPRSRHLNFKCNNSLLRADERYSILLNALLGVLYKQPHIVRTATRLYLTDRTTANPTGLILSAAQGMAMQRELTGETSSLHPVVCNTLEIVVH